MIRNVMIRCNKCIGGKMYSEFGTEDIVCFACGNRVLNPKTLSFTYLTITPKTKYDKSVVITNAEHKLLKKVVA